MTAASTMPRRTRVIGLVSHWSLTTVVLLGGLGLATSLTSGCSKRQPAEVEVEVRSVGFDNASRSPVVVLQDHNRKVALPIWIGPAEAQSIAMHMEGIAPPRPMTHDLIKTMLEGAGVELDRVVITELRGSTYYASIHLHTGRQGVEIDSRPSDAIALAVRFKRPIFVATSLLTGETSIDLLQQAPAAGTTTRSGVTVQNLTAELADHFSLPSGHGVLVANVSAVDPDGLQRGDIILEIDGETISGVGDFESKMQDIAPGATVRFLVQRGSARVDVKVTPPTG
jgi:bifunctional DNase/RNase